MALSYIGNKHNILPYIDKVLQEHHIKPQGKFCDAFAGTNTVGQYFKQKGFTIISNDIMNYSYAIARAIIKNNRTPSFSKLKNIIKPYNSVLIYFNNINLSNYKGDYCTKHYSPISKEHRMYFTVNNAKRIDFVRDTIDKWLKRKLISKNAFYYLLTSLLYASDAISNCTGTWGAYLKHWQKRAKLPLTLKPLSLYNNHKKNESYCIDANKLVHHIKGNVLYIDTPYNSRDYSSNYHVLETIALNDHPKIHGKTGQRDKNTKKSAFSRKNEALNAMRDLLKGLTFKHVVVSYSTDGIINYNDMVKLIKHVAYHHKVDIHKINYKEFQSKKQKNHQLYELLFYFVPANYYKMKNINQKIKNGLEPALQWVGGKQRLLPELLKHVPQHFNKYYECFAGGLALMFALKPQKAVINDFNSDLVTFYTELANHYYTPSKVYLKYPSKYMCSNNTSNLHNLLKYLETKNTKADYMKIRNMDQNKIITQLTPLELAARLMYLDKNGFNGIVRYSNTGYHHSKHENVPYGHHKTNNLINTNTAPDAKFLHSINLTTRIGDFESAIRDAKAGDFIYADPPYLKRTNTFKSSFTGYTNKGFGIKDQKRLAKVALQMKKKHVKMMLSNADVPIIKKLYPSKYFNVYHISIRTLIAASNKNRKKAGEVIITNY